ncbi:MAG: PorV/PorQ family protein, partial [Candidatus Margulisbacteria bacterium]|nr:PorV/PorQ family protein [Candidatus Margulisiibacteriota bacterium]
MPKYGRAFIIIFCLMMMSAGAALADIKFTSDITRLGVGARPLGMGKMFTGLADDISALYLNPAGLGNLETAEFLSMSGKFVNQVNYITLAGALPAKFGTLGIGYSGAGLGFSTPVLNLVEIATGEYRVIPSSTESVTYDYNNYAMALGYGVMLRSNLSVGAAVKFFNEKISGSTGGSAFGYDVDLGVLFKPNTSLTLGLLGKSILPFDMGGKVVWDTGLEESIPGSLNFGASLKTSFLRQTTFGADYELNLDQPNIPGFWHAGVEWWPSDLLALRGGIDQDVVGNDAGTGLNIASNQTAGVSLKFSNFRFDYAYHRYNDISTNDTHYFSLAYAAPEPIPLEVLFPPDKYITHEVTVFVKGKSEDYRIKSIKVNGRDVELDKHGNFETEVSLMLGKNTIWIAGVDRT